MNVLTTNFSVPIFTNANPVHRLEVSETSPPLSARIVRIPLWTSVSPFLSALFRAKYLFRLTMTESGILSTLGVCSTAFAFQIDINSSQGRRRNEISWHSSALEVVSNVLTRVPRVCTREYVRMQTLHISFAFLIVSQRINDQSSKLRRDRSDRVDLFFSSPLPFARVTHNGTLRSGELRFNRFKWSLLFVESSLCSNRLMQKRCTWILLTMCSV